MSAAGVVLSLLGVGLALRAGQLLAGRGRPRRGPQPAFVIAGPYLRMRNPLYAGVLIALGGAALGAASWPLALAALAAAALAHAWVVLVEEPRLVGRFGSAYEEYLRRVPRWVPRPRPDSV